MTDTKSSARELRDHLRRVGEVKAVQAKVELTPGEGVERTILHSEEHLDAFGSEGGDDDEFEAWLRVNAKLRALSG